MNQQKSTKPPSLFRLALPLIISFWMRSLFTFVDTLYASFLDDSAIAAIGLAIPLEFLMIAIWVGLSTGLTSYLSKAVGAKSVDLFDQVIRNGWKILSWVIPLFALIGLSVYFFAPHLGLDPKVARGFGIYGSVFLAGSALTGFWSIIPDSIVKAHHDTRSTMIAGILSNVINLGLNTLFLFVFHWGIFGIAFSTVLGRFGGLSYAIYRSRILERNRRQKLGFLPEIKDDLLPSPLKKILALSLPASLAYLLMAGENGLINYLLSTTENSTAALAAYGIFYRVILFALMPMIATTVAVIPFVARYSAQGNIKLIHRDFHSVLLGGILYSAFVIGPVCYFGAIPLMNILTQSAILVEYGTFAIQMVPLFCLAWVPYQLSRPVFEGFQQGRPTICMALLRYAILAMPLALLGRKWAPSLGYTCFQGLFFGILTATAIAGIIYLTWAEAFLRQKKRHSPKRAITG